MTPRVVTRTRARQLGFRMGEGGGCLDNSALQGFGGTVKHPIPSHHAPVIAYCKSCSATLLYSFFFVASTPTASHDFDSSDISHLSSFFVLRLIQSVVVWFISCLERTHQ